MSKERKKLEKKKAREKEVAKKLLTKRTEKRKAVSEERNFGRRLKRISKLQRDLGQRNQWAPEVLYGLDDSTLTQLEKNAKILRELEREHEDEVEKRAALNRQLESEGFLDIKGKLDALQNERVEAQLEEARRQEAAAQSTSVLKAPRKRRSGPPKEVSEVEVMRDPSAG